MSSSSSQEYPSRIASGLSLAASIPRICSTASRRPLMIGFPPNIFGFTVIRSRSFLSSIFSPLGESESQCLLSFHYPIDQALFKRTEWIQCGNGLCRPPEFGNCSVPLSRWPSLYFTSCTIAEYRLNVKGNGRNSRACQCAHTSRPHVLSADFKIDMDANSFIRKGVGNRPAW